MIKTKLSIVCVIIFETFVINFCKAEEKTITPNEIIQEAKENNPEIKALTQKYLSTKQKIVTAKTLEYPQIGSEITNKKPMYSVSQMFPFPGKLSLKGKVAENESKIAEQELNSKIREVVAQVKKSYWMYWLIDKTIETYQENIELMKRLWNIAKTQYAVGKVTQTDVLKANIELSEIENMLIMLEQERVSTQAELNALLNRTPESPLGKPEMPEQKEVKYTAKELENLALKNRPEILAKNFLYEKNVSGLNLSKKEWFPDIMAGAKLGSMSNTYMVQFAVPLYYKKQNSIVEAMKKEKEMAEWELQVIKINTLQQIKDLWTKYESRKKSIRIYETSIIPLTKQTLEITESGYRVGKNDFLDLLDSQKRYLEYNIEYYRRLAEKGIFFAELEKVVGVDLE